MKALNTIEWVEDVHTMIKFIRHQRNLWKIPINKCINALFLRHQNIIYDAEELERFRRIVKRMTNTNLTII